MFRSPDGECQLVYTIYQRCCVECNMHWYYNFVNAVWRTKLAAFDIDRRWIENMFTKLWKFSFQSLS